MNTIQLTDREHNWLKQLLEEVVSNDLTADMDAAASILKKLG